MLTSGNLFADRFIPLEEKNKGGTARIYLAYDKESGRQVALKIFDPLTLATPVLNEVWHREASALSTLNNHPNIIAYVDAGRCPESDLRYIALEWFDGLPLHQALKNHPPLKFERFNELFGSAILNALKYAAEKNIIHRDLSPGNILVAKDGSLKVIDFGQAKLKSIGVGLTVAGYATPPYCPPEQDTGVHTATRDAYSFSVITVRALTGKNIQDHDELYSILDTLDIPESLIFPIRSALSRDPNDRPKNILEFIQLLHDPANTSETQSFYTLNYRLSADIAAQVAVIATAEQDGEERVLEELNEAVAISTLQDDSAPNRFALETRSFRFVADLDVRTDCSIVIIGFVQRIQGLHQLWGENKWQPEVSFINKPPMTPSEIERATKNTGRFYAAFEKYVSGIKNSASKIDVTFEHWARLLDAMTEIERNRIPTLQYSKPTVAGRRLEIELLNPTDAEVGQTRIIRDGKRQVFAGEIESIDGNVCTLVSRFPIIRESELPFRGSLETDWNMARIAIQRQRNALERFRDGSIQNPRISAYITFKERGAEVPDYARTVKYFNGDLDNDKKAVVSQFMAMRDLLLIHGPPGTGKTTLIIELIRQFLAIDPSHKILFVSQTHVAIDHALGGLLKSDPKIKIVRIGSGTKELSANVRDCSIDQRGVELQASVVKSTDAFIKNEAADLGVDLDQVTLGMRAIELAQARKEKKRVTERISMLERESQELATQLNSTIGERLSTIDMDSKRSRSNSIDIELDEQRNLLQIAGAEEALSDKRLKDHSTDGRDLTKLRDDELDEWCEALLDEPEAKALKAFIEASEEWRMRFALSDDFKAAIIADSQVVAGTCVGFCREAAAASTEFDLCIIDEASKAMTTELLVPASQAKRLVLVGDHHQLPAVVDHELKSDDLRKEFALSHELIEKQLFELLQDELHDGVRSSLRTQFRMHSVIGDLISNCFYDRKLMSDSSCDERAVPSLELARLSHPITWYDTSIQNVTTRTEKTIGTSFFNETEAECAVHILRRLAFAGNSDAEIRKLKIGVISGYSAQVNYLRNEIDRDAQLKDLQIDCNSVHQFQGREVDICIYSVTRDNEKGDPGFLYEWRHLNVALSRARLRLVIVGSRDYCKKIDGVNPFEPVLKYIDENHPEQFTRWSRDSD